MIRGLLAVAVALLVGCGSVSAHNDASGAGGAPASGMGGSGGGGGGNAGASGSDAGQGGVGGASGSGRCVVGHSMVGSCTL